MKPLAFRLQCLSVLLTGMLLSNTACGPSGASTYGSDDGDVAALEFVQNKQAQETADWVLGNIFWERCKDLNLLNRKFLSEAESQACDHSNTAAEYIAYFQKEYPVITPLIGWILGTLGGAVALGTAFQLNAGAAAIPFTTAASGGATVLGLPATVAVSAVLAVIVAGVYLLDRAVAVYPLAAELLQLLVEFYHDRAFTTSDLLRVYELQTRIVDTFKLAFGAAGLSAIPIAASIMTLTQRAIGAYNTAPLVLSHTLPITVVQAQQRMYGYLEAQNIVKYTPVIVGQTAVFQQILADSSTAADAAPIFRAHIENVFATLATYGVTVSRSHQTASIYQVDGLGATAGYEGVYEITLPTTCQTSGCVASPVTIWLPATNGLLPAQTRPVVFAAVHLALDASAAGENITVTSGDTPDATTTDDPTVTATPSDSSDMASDWERLAQTLEKWGDQQAAALNGIAEAQADTAEAQADTAKAQAETAAAVRQIADEIRTGNQPPNKDFCNGVGTTLASAAPFVASGIAYIRLSSEDCATCDDRLNTAIVGAPVVAITTLIMRRRLFNLFQSGGAQTIGRLFHRVANTRLGTWSCTPNAVEGYDLAVSGIIAGVSTLAIGFMWSRLVDTGKGKDWAHGLCQGPLQCVNPNDDSEGSSGAAEGSGENPAVVDYTQCPDTARCEDKCVGACTDAFAEHYDATTSAAICSLACGEFKDAQAGTRNPHSLCAAQDAAALVCSGSLATESAWIDQLSQRGWVSCEGGASIAPSVSDCP
ncbi:MAG: hypothetical protein H6714_11220 [Myxococcales bacterium]|nr:hypothetical protein [Myxococcales bacterium]